VGSIRLSHRTVLLAEVTEAEAQGRGLHSSTSRLNISCFCGIRWVVSVFHDRKHLKLS